MPPTTEPKPNPEPPAVINIPLEVNPPPATDENLNNELDSLMDSHFKQESPKTNEIPPKVEKAPEKQVEVKKSKEVVKTEKKPEGELPKPETLEEATPKTQDGWTALKNNYKRTHRIINEREEEIKSLKTALAEKGNLSTKEIDALKNEVKELSKYRTMIDIQADPEFVSKYDQPIESAKNSVKDMLKGMQVSDAVLEQLDFSNTKLMDEVIGHVEQHQDKIVARRLQRKVEEIVDLMDKRDETLDSQKKDYSQFMEAKKKESSLKGAEDEGRTLKHLETLIGTKDKEGKEVFSFLVKKTAPEGISQPEAEQIERHNKLVDLMGQKVNLALEQSKTPEGKAEVSLAAGMSHFLTAQLRAAQGKIKSLEEELQKVASVGDETKETKPRGTTSKNGVGLDHETALNQFFAR